MTTYNIPPTSRYYNLPLGTLTGADGEQTVYLTRRFVPPSGGFALLHAHVVSDGERIDLIAARELGDAESYWRICDANDAMAPAALVAVGRTLRITLPEGIPGPQRT
jgi:hypothetical protein